MAWRDSRTHRGRLAFFMSSMILGVAALVAISSFSNSLEQTLHEESRGLLGADFALEKDNEDFSSDARTMIDSIGGRQAREVAFTSMALFPESGGTRLARIRAIDGPYPFYGWFTTTPEAAADTFQRGTYAVVDHNLMTQYNLEVGDSVRVGQQSYVIAGQLEGTSTENAAVSSLAPRIFVPRQHLDRSLLATGSQAEYRVYFAFDEVRNIDQLSDQIRARTPDEDLDIDTVEETQDRWTDALNDLNGFLNLVAFIALLLGGIGVGSAVHVYVKQKLKTVAVLRCVGARTSQTFTIYLIQAGTMGLAASVVGVLIGTGLQVFLPDLLQPYLPIDVTLSISWLAIVQGLLIGVGTALLFALLPLLSIRQVSPLQALRVAYESSSANKDPWRWAVGACIAAAVTAFAVIQTGEYDMGFAFAGGVTAVFLLLVGAARAIIYLVERFFPSHWPYVWRQGLANLHRPYNQTSVLMLSLGLGTFLVMTLFITQKTLLKQVTTADEGNRPNLVMFDIQSDQKEEITQIVRSQEVPILQDVPLVSMRIAAVNGRSADSLRSDPEANIRGWALRREYRSTYRDHLVDSETIRAGEWHGTAPDEGPVPVSLEEHITEDLNVWIGDRITFDVQGKRVETVVSSVRQVDWRRVQPNFFAVFPTGVLEEAPQFHVLVMRAPSSEASARVQQAVIEKYPTVSAIDLSLVIRTVDRLLGQQAFIIRFMALFSIVTGLIILAAAISNNRYQRIRESVLLKTLGASKRQIMSIMVVEYLFLGGLAALTGVILSYIGAWALARFLFDVSMDSAFLVMITAVFAITALTLLIGWFSSRGTYSYPPVEVLRLPD